jgi:hypothetical protein
MEFMTDTQLVISEKGSSDIVGEIGTEMTLRSWNFGSYYDIWWDESSFREETTRC